MSRRSLGTAAAVIGLFAAAVPAHAGARPGEPAAVIDDLGTKHTLLTTFYGDAYNNEMGVTAFLALQEATQMESRRFAPGTGGPA